MKVRVERVVVQRRGVELPLIIRNLDRVKGAQEMVIRSGATGPILGAGQCVKKKRSGFGKRKLKEAIVHRSNGYGANEWGASAGNFAARDFLGSESAREILGHLLRREKVAVKAAAIFHSHSQNMWILKFPRGGHGGLNGDSSIRKSEAGQPFVEELKDRRMIDGAFDIARQG